MSIEPFIGTKISLISKVGIRYEGSLHSLNTDDSTIVLNDVRCMGTEGRSKGNEVPPSSKVHDFVVFRGEDVSDIVVNDSKPVHDEPDFEDPAVFKTYKRDEFHTSGPSEHSRQRKPELKEVGIAKNYADRKNYSENFTNKNEGDYRDDFNKSEKNLESFQFDAEDDFDPSSFPISRPPNSGFKSTGVLEEEESEDGRNSEQPVKTENKVFYDKKSFYDNLSHEKQLSKSDLKQEHMKQREIDIATFGKFTIRNWHNRNHSHRGRRNSNSNQFNVKAGWEKSNPGNRNNN